MNKIFKKMYINSTNTVTLNHYILHEHMTTTVIIKPLGHSSFMPKMTLACL